MKAIGIVKIIKGLLIGTLTVQGYMLIAVYHNFLDVLLVTVFIGVVSFCIIAIYKIELLKILFDQPIGTLFFMNTTAFALCWHVKNDIFKDVINKSFKQLTEMTESQ